MMGLIIPYRDRQSNLDIFLPHITNFITDVPYSILIVEQSPEEMFNRAKLFNIGYDTLKSQCSYFCFHDVDLLPVNEECDYSPLIGVCKLSLHVEQLNYVERPLDELGGVTLIDKESFEKVNGYSNDFWGWGAEDNNFGRRCQKERIQFIRRPGRYDTIPGSVTGDSDVNGVVRPEVVNNRRLLVEKERSNDYKRDGINTLSYQNINSIDMSSNIKKITVNI